MFLIDYILRTAIFLAQTLCLVNGIIKIFQTVKLLGGTPLHYACRTGSLECVTALMSHCKFSINMSDSKGLTPIHRAAQNDQVAVVRSLLRRKPDLLEIPALEG